MTGTAVVTGAGRGLGARIADRIAGAGFDVVRADLAGGDVTLDITDAQACRDLASRVQPTVWVNNAGVLGPGDAALQPDEQVRRVIETNLWGTIVATRAAVEVMRQRDAGRGQGHIITVGSLASWVPVPGEAVYAATKAGVLSWTLALQSELRAAGVGGVRLSVICPDGMLTPMIVEELGNPAVDLSFSGLRVVDPDEVAQRVLSLLERPRPVASVPRWRGALVRTLGAVPDLALPLSGVFRTVGERNRRKAARAAGPTSAGAPSVAG
jgi:short-subunit dehydrogenase